jgi:hypothetical protein
MKNWIFLVIFITHLSFAQQLDSLNFIRLDPVWYKSIHKADSVTLSFQMERDRLFAIYQHEMSSIDSLRDLIQSKMDSISNLKFQTFQLTKKMDSLNHVARQKTFSLTKEIHEVKIKALKELKEIQLPPPLKAPIEQLQTSISGYSLDAFATSELGIPLKGLSDYRNIELTSLGKLIDLSSSDQISESIGNINQVMSSAVEYTQEAQSLIKGNIDNVQQLNKSIEAKLEEVSNLDQLKEGTALMDNMNAMDSAALANKAKEIVKEQIMNEAQNHFAGKQAALQQAMDKMSKMKDRYSEVQTMADLPKKLKSSLKGKPLAERVVPAITFQIQKSNYFLLDLNPMLMYRVKPNISMGAGWNYRFAFDKIVNKPSERVYGPRAAFEVGWKKGINFRFLPEIMNTLFPPLMVQAIGVDPNYRKWVSSLFFGIKKDFKIYKQLKGNTEILYNFYNHNGISPYNDKVSVRFGFEFPIKKKNCLSEN